MGNESTTLPMVRSVIVVGGGIAGIACALRLAEAGLRVTLLETRKKLGGRATSFQDPRSGLVIDNCQHVALGCCTNYLDLCARLGVLDKIRWLREQHWVEEGGRVSVIKPGMLPAPGHFAASFLGASFLTAREKVSIASAMQSSLTADRAMWRDKTFAQWLSAHMQTAGAVEKFWTPVMVSACNLNVGRLCAASALHVLQEGFLAHRDAAAVGVSDVPLVELYDAAEAVLARAGGTIRLGCGVERLWADRLVTSAGQRMAADAIVCAVPCERALKMVDESLRARDPRFAAMERIEHSPILGVHLTFDRPVLALHSAVLVKRATQWLFRKDARGTMVHAVISAADAWMDLGEEEIVARVLEDIHACLPESRGAVVESARSVKERLATFAPTPEVESARPAATGPSGLVLAGDYTQTGWPATMEGATRSGYIAAASLMNTSAARLLKPGLRPGMVVRALAPRLTRLMAHGTA